MEISKIPFVKLTNIKQSKNTLSLDFNNDILNHINTIHAGAQFTLAETQSGVFLQEIFPQLKDKVLPILRDAKIKYKKPAQENIFAVSSISDEDISKFNEQFKRKNRATIIVDVEIKDINDVTTTQASFTWFIQKI